MSIQNREERDAKNSEKAESQEQANDFAFLQERIKERPINKKKLLRKTIITAAMAVLFGVLACLSFLFLEPVLNNWLYPEEDPEVVTFPPEQNEMLPEDMLTEGTTTSPAQEPSNAEPSTVETSGTEVSDTAPIETEPAKTEAETQPATEDSGKHEELPPQENTSAAEVIAPIKSYQLMYEDLYKVYREVASSMVTVTAMHSEVDWFNNTYQSEGTTAGVVIANNNRELLILSRKSPLDNAETIRVDFCNGVSADAFIKQYDKNTNLAVLAVDLKYISSTTLDAVTVASMGSSAYANITGMPVIAIGNLFGYKDNVCYGIVTSKENTINMADSEYHLITTDIYASENPSGILVNLDRQIIGFIDNSHNNSDTKNLLSAIGITELKGLITKLSNGEDISYLGIYAQNISVQTRSELGLPQGAYIYNIDMDSPAMRSGIQKGDILVQAGPHEIRSAADYMNALRNAPAEKSIKLVVRRASVDQYEEMQFVVQPEVLE